MLATDPELDARVASIREQNTALRDALDPLLAEPLPERLVAAAAPQPSGHRSVSSAAGLRLRLPRRRFCWVSTRLARRDALMERSGTPTTFARQMAVAHAL